MTPTPSARTAFDRDGFVLAPGLFSPAECESHLEHWMEVIARGGDGWVDVPLDEGSPDPLARYPRLLQPHRGDDVALRFLLEPRIRTWLGAVLGEEPLAVQTMVYFKPPGARGQALHQDQRYLRVEPGTCTAAWLALEDTDVENGCLYVVPGSHRGPVICPGTSDPELSFTQDDVTPPPGMTAMPMPMRQGDVLFFHGQLIHGSRPNTSATRFRRIMVGHYIAADAEKVARYYFPVLDLDGNEVDGIGKNPWGGGPCGVPRQTPDGLVYDMVGVIDEATAAH